MWVHAERRARSSRATRGPCSGAGELFLAAGDSIAARDAAERALAVDPIEDAAYRLLAANP